MNGPVSSSGRRPRSRQRRVEAGAEPRRSVLGILVARASVGRPNPTVIRRTLYALLRTVIAAALAVPFALVWGIGHAQVDDYLGPHRARFTANYDGDIKVDLGPIGNAYLPSPVAPVGIAITVGGVGQTTESLSSFFSESTLAAYAGIYQEPNEAVAGVVERLEVDALQRSMIAEAVLMTLFAAWLLRRQLWSSWLVSKISRRRVAEIYVVITAVIIGSILVPRTPVGVRIPVDVAYGTKFAKLSVDSLLLSDLLDRGIQGIRLLSQRQEAAIKNYVDTAADSLASHAGRLPKPAPGETMIMGLSDLHCNQAMTELITRLERATEPGIVLSSGDDTVNGTAVERGCIRREAKIVDGTVPFLVATGNHDSDVTEAQMRSDDMTVLDGAVVKAAGIDVLGDDDPEHNIPFSATRTKDRAESEEQMAARLVGVAHDRHTDVILVHQPASALVIMRTPDPPVRLVLWGHFHAQAGPTVITHPDGSWTVGMQEGTAGGVRQPTFTSFSTPFSPPLISADVYFYFRDDATGLITGVQPVHFRPDAKVVIDQRITTGDLAALPPETRAKLGGGTPTPSPSGLPEGTPASAPPR
jgi:predicted phosphodiesterase